MTAEALAPATPGPILFVRYALASFMRFWLARLCWEQQAQTDRVVAALVSDVATGPCPPGSPGWAWSAMRRVCCPAAASTSFA